MNREENIKRVSDRLGWWVHLVQARACLQYTDINRVSEGLAATLLNAFYNLHLGNLNFESENWPGIDLNDETNGVAFQVTSTTTTSKIYESLKKVREEDHRKYNQGIRFLLISLGEKPSVTLKTARQYRPSFNPKTDILNVGDLIRLSAQYYDEDQTRWQMIDGILEEAFVQNPSTSTSGPRSDANGDSSDGSNIITGDNNQSGRVRFDQRSQQVLNQTNVGGDQLNATVGPGGMAIGKVQGDVHVYPPAPGTDFTDRASSETLKRLEELYSFREVTSGFQSQASCLSWCNKVAPLLKFNPDYYKKVIDGIDLLCFNLSSYSSGPVFQQIVNIVERAIEELKYSVPSPLRTFFCAPDFNRGQDTEDAEIGELMHHYGRRIEDTNELRILDVNHPVWEWTRTEVGRNAPRFMVIYGPYTSNFNKKGELIARYRIIGTGLHKPENKTELPLLELDILRTEEIHGCSGYPPERKLKSMNRIYVKYSDLSDGKWHEFEVPFSFDYGYLWEFRIEAFDGTHGKPDNIAHYGNSVRLFFDNISIYNAL